MPITPTPTASATEARPQIMVADDSRVIRQAIKKIVGTDFEIIQAEDGANAWDLLQRNPEIKALVTDIEMPNVDGYELICRIRGSDDARLRDMPVIAITGAEDEETRQRAFACGATDFITKPIDATQLQARVRAYVRYDQTTRELTEKSAVLEAQAVSDPVTGLRSRRYFLERGEQDVAFSLRRGKDLSLICVEIDGLKKIYQSHGDDVSDRLLTWFSKILFANARTEDTVARISGTEFAVLANAIDIETATAICTRLCKSVTAQPFSDNVTMIKVTVSVGVASVGQDRRDNIESLLKLAQQRLYHAQSEGGNSICTSMEQERALEVVEVMVPSIEPTAPAEPTLAMFEQEEVTPMLEPESAIPSVELEADVEMYSSVPTPAPATMSAELLSLDRALQLINEGRGELVKPYLSQLLQQIRPLLDFCQRVNKK